MRRPSAPVAFLHCFRFLNLYFSFLLLSDGACVGARILRTAGGGGVDDRPAMAGEPAPLYFHVRSTRARTLALCPLQLFGLGLSFSVAARLFFFVALGLSLVGRAVARQKHHLVLSAPSPTLTPRNKSCSPVPSLGHLHTLRLSRWWPASPFWGRAAMRKVVVRAGWIDGRTSGEGTTHPSVCLGALQHSTPHGLGYRD